MIILVNLDGENPSKRQVKAFTMVEVMIGVCILGIMLVSLYTGIYSGFAIVKLSRDNQRATQILLKKVETLRLYNWGQITDTNNFLKPTFTDYYDPTTESGTFYSGTLVTNLPNFNAAYRTNMRMVTVTLYWTNYPEKPSNNQVVVRSRQMQTYVARYGMQSYLYQ